MYQSMHILTIFDLQTMGFALAPRLPRLKKPSSTLMAQHDCDGTVYGRPIRYWRQSSRA